MALDPSRYAALKAAMLAETDPAFVSARDSGAVGLIADFYNAAATPAFIVWKSLVSLKDVGDKFNGSEFSGLSTANVSRLSAFADYSQEGINPALADRRQFFDDVFSVGGITKAALLVLWKRDARRIEKLYATGTGSSASPAILVFEGTVDGNDIIQARDR